MTGVLTLTATPDNFSAHTLGTVQAAAEAIGQQLTLRRLLAEQQSILETLNEGVVVCDRDGRIKTLNRYARQIFAGIDTDNALIDQCCSPSPVHCSHCPAVMTARWCSAPMADPVFHAWSR